MSKYILIVTVLLAGCNCQKKTVSHDVLAATEAFIIYKTTADYYDKVPVLLDSAKTILLSYPAVSDVTVDGDIMLPLQLENGYLLDRRGIGPNVAFTSYTYTEYAQLKETPSASQLFGSIIDSSPLVEMYDCSEHVAIKSNLKKVNHLVRQNFTGCSKVK